MAEKGKQQHVSESSENNTEEEREEESLANDLVVTKYAMAADIVNAVMKEVLAAIKEGVEVGTLCDLGDKMILERTSKVFKKEKEVLKGIAMPTCVSIDNCICHFSPLRSDPPVVLRNGQMVKVDLGAHIDGFIATAAHTVVVGASSSEKVSGTKANVIMAAYNAMEVAMRMLRPGLYKNMEITDMIDKIASIYKVKPIENMLSHELKKNKIDGEKQIIQNPGEKQRSDMVKCSFEKYEAYAVDILMSTGEGKTRDLDTRTTVYKKADDLSEKVSGTKANVIMAAYNAMEVAMRMLRPGLYKNMEITDMIDKIASIYKVKPIENMLSHELKKNKIDGEKQIIQNPGEKQRSDMVKCSFEKYEAYAVDILMSTGEGKTRDLDTRTTVYKKADDLVYSLKMKASRTFFSAAVNKYGAMPFTLRSFEDERGAKMGVIECERHALMRPYQVLYERDTEFVAQFKATVLVMPNGLLKITGLPLDTSCIECDVKIDDPSVSSLLNSSLKPKKSKKKAEVGDKKTAASIDKKAEEQKTEVKSAA
ncbi:Proliferation-associated protein 2G4 [Toxocara canis]|uniref:Proliferation-associated protein 2G4 n=1 Tax=Toxocara canis TaxID=6265 RepID=A0A0B2VH06_TOXCA|nr:Proliferation-associated protein 2G4 [Toxocara canis]